MLMKTPEPSSLRHVAEGLDRYEGYRVEIIGGTLMMSPSPRFKHARILRKLYDQLHARVPRDYVCGWGESVTSPEHGEDYVEPDLMVYPESCEQGEEWSVPGIEVPLVVEVVSVSNVARDTVDKLRWYAVARVTTYLLIDPRQGTWSLFSEPSEGEYRVTRHGRFGDVIPLPEPIDVKVETGEFRRYEL